MKTEIKSAEAIVDTYKGSSEYPQLITRHEAELACEAYHEQFERWNKVEDKEASTEPYYQLADRDDVYLDIYYYIPKGIDGNSMAYFRSVNDNSTLDLSEVSHYREFNTDAPDWAELPIPPQK